MATLRFPSPTPMSGRFRQDGPVDTTDGYALLDIGDLRRLERFGRWRLDRPAPSEGGFARRDPPAWADADARFEAGDDGPGRWVTRLADADVPWTCSIADLTFELRLAGSGQIGCFPEQAPSWSWIGQRVTEMADATVGLDVLDLFAHTGGSTFAAARAGARVVHVDAGRPAIAWARRNAELNGLAGAPVRWIVDDALRFTEREARRAHRYAGVILDPPSFGHDPAGRPWRLDADLPRLLEACVAVLAVGPAFVVLSAHTPGFGPDRLGDALDRALGTAGGGTIELDELAIPAASGRRLELGSVARWRR